MQNNNDSSKILTIKNHLEKMWQDYCQLNPQALIIYQALSAKNKYIANDHIALRTLQHPKLGIQSLAKHFEKFGYKSCGEYQFVEKKLFALHFENAIDPSLPKIFISELILSKMSIQTQNVFDQILSAFSNDFTNSENFPYSGIYWDINYKTYLELANESEYASWFYAFGFRPNHFTVSINHLDQTQDINKLNEFIKSLGIKLNNSGGEVKGTPEELLEQSSTMANHIEVSFTDGQFKIPACYYEFAKRYPLKNGQLYQGFIAKSADKIFESTNR